jgi:hypothetical protein
MQPVRTLGLLARDSFGLDELKELAGEYSSVADLDDMVKRETSRRKGREDASGDEG